MIRFIAAALGLTLAFSTPAQAGDKSIIVLDASGSMWGQIGAFTKVEIAREALRMVLTDMDPAAEVGLLTYGHREKGNCADIELMVAPAPGTAQAIIDVAAGLEFKGKTPLTEAVRQAAVALKYSEEKATVILITDGVETCEADPCALGIELESSGVDFTAHVVGFGLSAEEGAQVACLATNTGGQYIEAKDAAGLQSALKTAVAVAAPEPAPAPEPEPQPANLEVNFAPTLLLAPGIAKPDDNTDIVWEIHAINADGTMGERITTEFNAYKGFIEPGTYRLLVTLGQARQELDITLTADSLTAPEVVMNAARIIVHPKPSAAEPVADEAALTFTNASGMDTTEYGSSRVYLPAGEFTLDAKLGEARVSETLTLAPGELLERDIIIGSGLAVVDGFYVDGMRMETTQHSVEIVQAKKALDGSRASVTTSFGPAQEFNLAPGDYVAIVTLDAATAEAAFTVKVGERTDVAVTLNAGVLAVSAAGATSIEVLSAKTDLNGNRTTLSFHYSDNTTTTLPEGDVVVQVKRGEVISEATATVKKGERTEVTVP